MYDLEVSFTNSQAEKGTGAGEDPPQDLFLPPQSGRRLAVLFVKAYERVVAPGLVQLDPALPEYLARRSPLAQAWRRLDAVLDDYLTTRLVDP